MSRRTGTSVPVLRAWETRYGVLRPQRSPGGFRLYSAADEARVLKMRHHIATGMAAAEAARLVEAQTASATGESSAGDALVALRSAFDGYDGAAARAALDRLADMFGVEMFLSHVVLPYLRELGERWDRGDVSVAEEHFATGILRARMLERAGATGTDTGKEPMVVLACPEGELHDLPLIALAMALRARGARVAVLGAHMPVEGIVATADRLEPVAVVVSAILRDPAVRSTAALRTLARRHRVVLAGPGFDDDLARDAGAEYTAADPVGAAERLLPARGGPA